MERSHSRAHPKRGKVVANLPSSYRPVLLMSIIYKVTEHIMLARLEFGFQCHLSTQHVLVYATDIIIRNFTHNNHMRMMLLDLSHAFDKVHHNTLLLKLAFLGFKPAFIPILHSLLETHTFHVRFEWSTSRPWAITAGVCQGSMLLRLLFSLYTHDIPNPTECTVVMYVDNTAILALSTDLHFSARLTMAVRTNTTHFQSWGIPRIANKTGTIIFTRHCPKLPPPISVHTTLFVGNGACLSCVQFLLPYASAIFTYVTTTRVLPITACFNNPLPATLGYHRKTNAFGYNTAYTALPRTLISTYAACFFTKARKNILPTEQQIAIHDLLETYPHRLLIDFPGYRPPSQEGGRPSANQQSVYIFKQHWVDKTKIWKPNKEAQWAGMAIIKTNIWKLNKGAQWACMAIIKTKIWKPNKGAQWAGMSIIKTKIWKPNKGAQWACMAIIKTKIWKPNKGAQWAGMAIIKTKIWKPNKGAQWAGMAIIKTKIWKPNKGAQ
ncbi:hypothetical protein PR048_016531 [Dryococelus australis]|uniref:Reverse transcriptase domain-containing protein n=1 Tax=Dryococelus australis TaxID=614101 RepID=A0ABQ9HK13_9NEOP|nr:hypothetical protein PR048_016531 [Dryococelus australis]